MNKYKDLISGVLMVGQFGFMIVTPPLCLALLANWLIKKFNTGIWLMFVFLLIGLLTSVSSAVDFFRSNQKKAAEDAKKVTLSFRTHR